MSIFVCKYGFELLLIECVQRGRRHYGSAATSGHAVNRAFIALENYDASLNVVSADHIQNSSMASPFSNQIH